MAEWHLKELRNAIERSGWRFVAEHPLDDLYISASWEFKRGGKEPVLWIDFGGIDDLRTLPIERSYGCQARHRPSVKDCIFDERAAVTLLSVRSG